MRNIILLVAASLLFGFLPNTLTANEILLKCEMESDGSEVDKFVNDLLYKNQEWFVHLMGLEIGDEVLFIQTHPNKEIRDTYSIWETGDLIQASKMDALSGALDSTSLFTINRLTGRAWEGRLYTEKYLREFFDGEQVSDIRKREINQNRGADEGIWLGDFYKCEKTNRIF